MIEIFFTVAPVFGLIALGFLAAKLKLAPASTGQGLSGFVFLMALPALLFQTMVKVKPPEAAPWGLWGTYFGAVFLVWVLAIVLGRRVAPFHEQGGAVAGMASGFSNLLMLGLPLVYAHYGPEAALAAALIISIHAPLQWTAATLHIEIARRGRGVPLVQLGRELVRTLTRNAIVLALLSGTAWRLTGLGLHPVIDKMIGMLAEASVPSALVALGLTLASYELKAQIGPSLLLILLKMGVMPLFAALLAGPVFGLPPLWQAVAILFAVLPTGANAYLFANRYESGVGAVSAAIALGTALAALTVPAIMWLIDRFLLAQ